MHFRYTIVSITFIALLISLAVIGTAGAQLDNKPFSFKNSSTGGPGMSQGGRQAIINEELFDSTPSNLLRGPDGFLLDVVEGPGNSAIIFRHGTTSSIPGFHGTSFRGNNELMQVGVFNAYFGPSHNNSGFASYAYSQYQTNEMINMWVMGLKPGSSMSVYSGSNPVNSWTLFVNDLQQE